MNNADEALLILLAVVLAILILLLIWAMVYVLKVLRGIKRVVADAEKLVDSAEVVGEAFRSASGPIALFKLINNLGKIVSKQRGGKK